MRPFLWMVSGLLIGGWGGLGLRRLRVLTWCQGRSPAPTLCLLFQLERLRASYEELQAQSREEIQCLGAQLESARSSRQELSGERLVFPIQVPGRESCSLNC